MTKKTFQDQHARAREKDPDVEVVAQDEMHTITRSANSVDDPLEWLHSKYGDDMTLPTEEEMGPLTGTLLKEFASYEERLTDLGWPSPGKIVLVEGDHFKEVDLQSLVALSRKEDLEHGCAYTLGRAEPDSEAYWLAQLCNLIIQFCEEPDNVIRTQIALKLGRLQADFNARLNHLPAVQRTAKQLRALHDDADGGRAASNRSRKQIANVWHAHALELASRYWDKKPSASISEVAAHVGSQMTRDGSVSADGTAPSKERIRKVISSLSPRR